MPGDNTNNAPVTLETTAPLETPATTVLTGDESTEAGDEPVTEAAPANAGAKEGEGDNKSSTETYADFVMPEGVQVDTQLLGEAVSLFKELGLTQDQAQKLVDFQAKQQQAQVNNFNHQLQAWANESKNDKEFGGDKFEQSVALARSAISKFGTPELKALLNDHGVGNHPEIVRFMVKVGKLTAEDVPGSKTAARSQEQDHVSLLYPNDRNG